MKAVSDCQCFCECGREGEPEVVSRAFEPVEALYLCRDCREASRESDNARWWHYADSSGEELEAGAWAALKEQAANAGRYF